MLKKTNYGICLLRIVMCFEVIIAHFYHETNVPFLMKPFVIISGYAVPCFMIVAFYFSASIFINSDITKYKNRMYRLVVPHVGWSIIYFFVLNVIALIENGDPCTLKALFLQLLFGHSIIASMWFMVNLIWITILFFAISKTKLNFTYALLIILIICLLIQYSGLTLPLYNLGFNLSYPVGRIFCMIPCASLGVILYKYNLLERLKRHSVYAFVLSVGGMAFSIVLNSKPEGFGYSGISALLFGICLVVGFYVLPFEKLPALLKCLLSWLSRYTMGIYASHSLIGNNINRIINFIFPVQLNDFIYCIIVFVCGVFVVNLIALIPFKWCKQIVS